MNKKDDALKLALDWYDSGNENPDDFANMIKQVIALAEQPAQGCDYCNNPQYAGTKCKNCGREQPVQQQEPAPGYCKHCKQYTIEEPLPAQPSKPWVGLTDEEELKLAQDSMGKSRHWLVAQVGTKLREKNA